MLQQNETLVQSPLLANYSRYEVEFTAGKGAYLYDEAGKQYLDFLSGIAVTGFGHNHPEIRTTMREAIDKPWHVSNLFTISQQEKLAGMLTQASGLDAAFFCNSGTEANEAAIKFARKWGAGRAKIIAAKESFHGRTYGALSATGQDKFWEGFGPMLPGFTFVPFNDISALEAAIDEETVAVMLEPVQGESGVIVPSEGYLSAVRALCNKHNVLLILDEVQTGMGRTGKMFAHQWYGITPDIMTLAKGIANGLPLGATLCTAEVAALMKPGTHGSTFGGNPIAVSVACKVMELLTGELLTSNSSIGEAILEAIAGLLHPAIKEIRGKGLMLGIELYPGYDAKKVAIKALENGLVVGTSGAAVVRLLPPFTVGITEVELFTQLFGKALDEY